MSLYWITTIGIVWLIKQYHIYITYTKCYCFIWVTIGYSIELKNIVIYGKYMLIKIKIT